MRKFQLDQPCPLVYFMRFNLFAAGNQQISAASIIVFGCASMKNNKLFGWLIKSLLVLIFLIFVVVVFTPRLINLEMVKKNIKEKISSDIGGRITYRNLKLSFFPRPHVVIHKSEISIPDSFTINIQWMRIYPRILPLLRGRLEFAVVRLDYADYSMILPRIKEATAQQSEESASFPKMMGALTNWVRDLPKIKLPDINLRIKNGKVNLVDPFGRQFKLREVQAAYIHSKNKITNSKHQIPNKFQITILNEQKRFQNSPIKALPAGNHIPDHE